MSRIFNKNITAHAAPATTTSRRLYTFQCTNLRCTTFSFSLIRCTLVREKVVLATLHITLHSEPQWWSSAFKENVHQRTWQSYPAQEAFLHRFGRVAAVGVTVRFNSGVFKYMPKKAGIILIKGFTYSHKNDQTLLRQVVDSSKQHQRIRYVNICGFYF